MYVGKAIHSHMHACTHTHTHTCMHTYVGAHMHARIGVHHVHENIMQCRPTTPSAVNSLEAQVFSQSLNAQETFQPMLGRPGVWVLYIVHVTYIAGLNLQRLRVFTAISIAAI